MATRPIQLMSDTSAAMRAAKDVQADSLSPELFRQANEWFTRAKKEYRYKNFYATQEYASKAKKYAELAEFDAIRNGGVRDLVDHGEESRENERSTKLQVQGSGSASHETPEQGGMSVEAYEEHKAAEEEAKKQKALELEKLKEPGPAPTAASDGPVIRPNLNLNRK